MKSLLTIICFFIAATTVSAQVPRIRSGTTLPTSCRAGANSDIFIKTNAPTGAKIYVATASSPSCTWEQQGNAGSSSTGLILISKQTCSVGGCTISWSSLDGNVDGVYLINYRLYASGVFMTVNGSISNFTNEQCNNGSCSGASDSRICSSNPSGACYGTLIFFARASVGGLGKQRVYISSFIKVNSDNHIENWDIRGLWNDTSANVTSISFGAGAVDQGSEAALYKYGE